MICNVYGMICIVKCVLFTEKEIRNEETTESIET